MKPAAGLAALAAVTVALVAALGGGEPRAVVVAPGESVGAAADGGASVIELGAGRHEPFTITVPGVTVRGLDGSIVDGPVAVLADDVTLRDLAVAGGDTGVVVREADGAVLRDVHVRGAALHGIEVVDGSASISGCRVSGLRSEYAQGVEVRNANSRPRTIVRGCVVDGGQEGIVSHVSRVEIVDNHVRGTTMRGIAITEMSEGIAEGNEVEDGAGVGLYCGDMSHCEVRDNAVHGMAPAEITSRSHAGHAVVAWYHSAMRVRGTTATGLAGDEVAVLHDSRLTDDFPLSIWPAGWRGALPAMPAAAVALAALALVRLPASRAVARLRRHDEASAPGPVASTRHLVLGAALGGLAVQVFHMVEHVVQVWQVYVAEGQERSGIVGARADTEWVHLVFNAAVMAFLVLLWRAGRPNGVLPRRAASWLLAAGAVQGYHLVEHVAKVLQHEVRGIRVAPGLLGDDVGLVWFHFGINLAVFAGTALAVAGMAAAALRHRQPATDAEAADPAPERVLAGA